MEGQRSVKSLLICFLCAGLLSLSPVVCTSRSLEGSSIKPDCDCETPSHGHGGHHATPVPSHGSSGTPSAPSHGSGGYYGTPSPSQGSSGSHGTPDPTHGTPSGGSYGTPTVPSYTTPTAPSHGSGGYYGTPSPSQGSSGSHGTPDPTHGTPAHGSGGSYGTPTVPSYTTPTAPSHGSGGYYGTPVAVPPPTSTTPVVEPPVISAPAIPVITPPVVSTPAVPDVPTIPGISTPSSPLVPVDPHIPFYMPGTCYYWSTHPAAIWAIFGYWGTVGEHFGAACVSAFGTNPSLQDALKNTRTDSIGALFREGTAAFLNSMVCTRYALSTPQVTHAFAAAATSNKKAAVQAELFKKANEGRVIKA